MAIRINSAKDLEVYKKGYDFAILLRKSAGCSVA